MRHGGRSLDERATWAGFEQSLGERPAAAWPDKLEMAEPGPAENLRRPRIGGGRGVQRPANPLARPLFVAADKHHDDAAAQIAQQPLSGDRGTRHDIHYQPGATWR